MLDSISVSIVADDGNEDEALLTVRENIDGGPCAMYMIEMQHLDGAGMGTIYMSLGEIKSLAKAIEEVLP